jgi:uncharacterized repeat protein (TIGR01451 family)
MTISLFKNKKIHLAFLVGALLMVGGTVASYDNSHTARASVTELAAPTVHLQFGDAGSSRPNHPGDCGNQAANIGTSTTDTNDPDCLRAQFANPGSGPFEYTSDFRFCLVFSSGATGCTGWASDAAGLEPGAGSASGWISGGQGGNLAGTMTARIDTRAFPSSWPAGTTISNVSIGVALGYQNNNGPCGTSSALQWVNDSSTSMSSWGYGEYNDDDPGCFDAGLQIGTINSPPDAEYVNTTIPSTLSSGSHLGNYNIVMKNKGKTWPLYSESNSKVHDVDGHCATGTYNYAGDGSTCEDYIIWSSQRYRLARTDTEPVGITSKALAPNSNAVEYGQDGYTYSGSDTVIVKPATDTGYTTSNTIPFYVKQKIVYTRHVGSTEICVPGDGVGYEKSLWQKLLSFIKIPTAQAYRAPNDEVIGDTCRIRNYDYVSTTRDPLALDIVLDDNATFAPVNLNMPVSGGPFTLRFQMIDLDNLNTSDENYSNGRFGDVAPIPVALTALPWSLTCGVNQTVDQGSNANYDLAAIVPGGYSTAINVTMASTPLGATMTTSPVVLASSNLPLPYRGIAVVPTSSLTPNTYILTFSGTDGTGTNTCQSQLLVRAVLATPDIKFNSSDGPTTPNPAGGSTGTLTWNTANAASCTGSMQTGADTTPGWVGAKTEGNVDEQSFNVTGLQSNTKYVFKIQCVNSFGQSGPEDTVEVNVGSAQNPTTDLKCQSGSQGIPSNGPCTIANGASALLYWSSSYSSSCSINNNIGSVATSETAGQSTGSLYANTTYTLTCTGPGGTISDSVDIIVNTPPDAVLVWADNATCGVVTVNWGRRRGAAIPTGYRVYNGSSSTGPWNDISGLLSSDTYTYTHGAPASSNNYYMVRAYNGTAVSPDSNAVLSNKTSCAPVMDASDKDVTHVSGKITKDFAAAVACSGVSEIASLPNNALFSPDDVVTFQINVCNSGNTPLSGVHIVDTLEKLTVPSTPVSDNCTISNYSFDGIKTMNFDLSNVPAMPSGNTNPSFCKVTFTAKVTSPTTGTAALYRFQNIADITTNELPKKRVVTPPYLFSNTGGVPDRTETAPR